MSLPYRPTISLLGIALLLLCHCVSALAEPQRLQLAGEVGAQTLIPYIHTLIASAREGALQPADLLRENLPWQPPVDEAITFGIVDKVCWLRIDLHTAPTIASAWFLRIGSSNIDLFDVYEVIDTNISAPQHFGSALPYDSRQIDNPDFIIPLNLPPDRNVTLLLRIQHHGFLDAPLQLLTPTALAKTMFKKTMPTGFYFGAITIMLIYNLFLFFSTKDRTYFFYSGFVAALGLFFSSVDGNAFRFLWPHTPALNKISIPLFVQLLSIFSVLFTRSFFRLTESLAFIRPFLTAVFLIQLALLLISPFFPADIGIAFAATEALVIFPALLAIGVLSWLRQDPYAKYIVWAWTLLLFTAAFLAAAALNLMRLPMTGWWDWFHLSSTIQMVFFSVGLAQRINYLIAQDAKNRAERAAKSKFIERISHELRTPMNAILGMSELLAERLTDATERRYNEVIFQSSLSLVGVINDVLDAAKIDADKLSLENSLFDLHQLARNCLQTIEPQAHTKGIALHCEIGDVPCSVMGDPIRLKQVLLNLLNNACQFTEQGSITLYLMRKAGDDIEFTVRDTGVGMDEATQRSLFDSHHENGGGKSREYGGAGLGLYLCARLTALMKGRISVGSRLGSGTTITITLPLPAAPIIAAPVAQRTPTPARDREVLVAEDNIINQLLMEKMLQRLQARCVVVSDGAAALAAVRREPERFGLIFMDCDMPIMDGFTATRQLRIWESDQQRAPIAVIALTAHALSQYEEDCRCAGMNERIAKPITLAVLQQALTKYLAG